MKNLSDENIESLLERAKTAETAGQHLMAFELFKRVSDLTTSKPVAYFRAARNLIDLGRYAEAESFLKKKYDVPSAKRWVFEIVFGELCMAQFKPCEAERHFKTAFELNPKSTSPAIFYADCLMKQEQFQEAENVLLKALEANGDLDEVYLNLGCAKRAIGDYQSARLYFIKACEITPDYADASKALADVTAWLEFENCD